jgi:hypothetical protein
LLPRRRDVHFGGLEGREGDEGGGEGLEGEIEGEGGEGDGDGEEEEDRGRPAMVMFDSGGVRLYVPVDVVVRQLFAKENCTGQHL